MTPELIQAKLNNLHTLIDNLDESAKEGLFELEQAMRQLQEGQSRFMSGIFDTVNETNSRCRGLEGRVARLEALVNCLYGGTYDARIARSDSDNQATAVFTGYPRTREDSPREGGSPTGPLGSWESDGGRGSEAPRQEDGQEKW